MYQIYAFFDMEKLNAQVLEHLMQLLPEQRRVKAMHYRQEIDRKNCAAAWFLLLHALYVHYGIRAPRISYSGTGKPYLTDYPNIHFNISHCPKGCICGISDVPIGVDIQDARPFSQGVAERCCTAEELRVLKRAADPASEFTKMWAMKESYLKMLGTGITQGLSDIDTAGGDSGILTFQSNSCCIAVASAEHVREESICMS